MSNEGRPRGPLKFDLLAIAVAVLLSGEILLHGADDPGLSMPLAIVHLLLLAAVIVFSRGASPPPLPILAPAVLLGGVFALGVFSVLPLGPPLAHPMWSEVQALVPGTAATISLDPVLTRIRLLQLAGLAALFLTGAALGWQRERAERFSSYVTVAGIAYCLWAGCLFVTSRAEQLKFNGRLTASFSSANPASCLFAVLAVFGLMGVVRPIVRAREKGERLRLTEFVQGWPQLMLLALAMTCLFLTQSRGGLTALTAAVLLALALITWIRTSRGSLTGGLLAVLFAVLCAGVVAVLLGGQHTTERIQTTDVNNIDRLRIVAAYWPTVMRAPWFGYGMGSFPFFHAASLTRQNFDLMGTVHSVHNVYIDWLLQTGFTGAACMFGAVLTVVMLTIRGVVRRSSQQALGVACVASVLVFAVDGLTDFTLEEPAMSALLAVILGMGLGLAERPSSAGGVRRRRKSRDSAQAAP